MKTPLVTTFVPVAPVSATEGAENENVPVATAVVRVVSVMTPGWRGHYGIASLAPVSYQIAWKQPEAGLAVAGVWLLMVIGRSWQPEPSWLDRAGIGLGVIWIVMYLIDNGYFYSMMM